MNNSASTFSLPAPFEWIEIPAGSVTIIDGTIVNGTPGGEYHVADFAIAKYPVTNAQYRVFVETRDGYQNPSWWDFSDDAQQWRSGHVHSFGPLVTSDDLPRTYVCWYDAMAFCRWLSYKLDMRITLPTEQQWQRAAQGDDNRRYPWGNKAPNARLRCNFGEKVGKLTPVTRYPKGASPYGVMDMCGNCREWCLTKWGTDSVDVTGKEPRVQRGSTWFDSFQYQPVARRHADHPFVELELAGVGLRVVKLLSES